MRHLLARAVYWLKGLRSKEHHRRLTAAALCGKHRPDLSAQGRAEVAAHERIAEIWRSGEYDVLPPSPTDGSTQRSDFALQQFHADPLGAAILPAELDEVTEFFGAIKTTTLTGRLTEAGASDLESTGAWYAWEIRQMVARGSR